MKLSVALLSVLAIGAAAGCKKKVDCGASIGGFLDRQWADGMKKYGDKLSEADKKELAEGQKTKLAGMTKLCTDDAWSADVLKCLDNLKEDGNPETCQAMLTPAQRANADKADKADTAAHKTSPVAEALAMMAGFKDQMCACRDKACGDKVHAGMTAAMTEMAKRGAKDVTPSDSEMKKMADVMQELTRCSAKLDPPPAAPAPGEGAVAAAGMPPECADYKAKIDRLAACDQIPQEARDAQKTGFEQMSAAWASGAELPAEARRALGERCKTAAEAIAEGGKAMCGW